MVGLPNQIQLNYHPLYMIWSKYLQDGTPFYKYYGLSWRYFDSFSFSLLIGGKKSLSTVLIVTITIVGAVFLGLFICLAWRFKSKLKGEFHLPKGTIYEGELRKMHQFLDIYLNFIFHFDV